MGVGECCIMDMSIIIWFCSGIDYITDLNMVHGFCMIVAPLGIGTTEDNTISAWIHVCYCISNMIWRSMLSYASWQSFFPWLFFFMFIKKASFPINPNWTKLNWNWKPKYQNPLTQTGVNEQKSENNINNNPGKKYSCLLFSSAATNFCMTR